MVQYVSGDIFESQCRVLVNPVNMVGISGAGLALLFRHKYPTNYLKYREACENNLFTRDQIFVVPVRHPTTRFIVNFPTKAYYNELPRIEHLTLPLSALDKWLSRNKPESVAIPALGCETGGLKWEEVKPLIQALCDKHPEISFCVYEPSEKGN